jgi:serine/threonine protein kinase
MKVCRLCRRYASGAADQCTFDGGELLDAPVPPVAPGETIGPYTVKRALAAGQSGVLLLCSREVESPATVEPAAPPSATEEAPKTAVEEEPPSATEDAPKTATEDAPKTATEDTPPSATEDAPKTATEDAPATATEEAPKTTEEEEATRTATGEATSTAAAEAPASAAEEEPPAATEEAPPDEVVVKVLNKAVGSIDARRPVLESAAALSMEGLQPILEVFEHGERLCVTQSLMQGSTLAALLPKLGPLDEADAVAIGRRLCEVLTVVHESGLAHLDLRPGHLFVPEGASPRDAVLFDLGAPSPPGRLTAPELFTGRTPSPQATDVYGLCVTLYVLLGGRSPFRTDDPEELSWLIRSAPPPPLRVVRRTGGVDPSLERLILWGMAKDPRDRPSLSRVATALTAIAEGDHETVDRVLERSAEATSKVQRSSRSSRPAFPSSRSPLPRFLSDTSATLRVVQKILPKGVLRSTGVTQGFFIEGEEMEREVAAAEAEDRLARHENLVAWLRLAALLAVALALGGLAVWAAMR